MELEYEISAETAEYWKDRAKRVMSEDFLLRRGEILFVVYRFEGSLDGELGPISDINMIDISTTCCFPRIEESGGEPGIDVGEYLIRLRVI